ncbi:hypothetical protein ACWT_6628 [Actinoplanes sp. SE50]|nr:hypothetical protein ACPL_6758 [Actinoplanes sp. SE50/110]ATO86043.1 hypothetical protein ACWT_6628 [Actinoplanes sp. SE50]SLM03457.1 hypothetical protein ACSP50_6746 [Actinoplanes sp. SE50/110]
MLARLVDRSVERIGEMSAGGRWFDRHEAGMIAEAWADRARDVFGMLGVWPRVMRDRKARTILRRMADSRAGLRDWMVAAGGPGMDRLLGPAAAEPPFYRDFRGRVQPGTVSSDPAGIAEDYDLARARVASVWAERAGDGLRGSVRVLVPRRYADGEALLTFGADRVRDLWFDSADGAGLVVRRHGDGFEVRLGAEGVMRTAALSCFPVDQQWHLSAAGRTADRVTSRRRPPTAADLFEDWADGARGDAGAAFQAAVRRLGRLRVPEEMARIPVGELCEALVGAGTRALAAADLPSEQRFAAWRDLLARWSRVGPDGPEAEGELPAGVRLALVTYEAEPAVLTAIFTGADDERLAAAKLPWPHRLLLSGQAGELTLPDTAHGA